MGYLNAIRNFDEVLVWERNEDNERIIVTHDTPYYFYVKDKKGEYTSMYGDKLSRLDFTNSKDFAAAKQECERNRIEMFESDIPPELKVLSEKYYGTLTPNINITFWDIEVDYNPELGFSSVDNPYAPINSVALYHKWLDKTTLLAVPPENWDGKLDPELHDLADITICKNEKELLLILLAEIQDSDILTGWNSDFYDTPYVAKRVEKVLGKSYLRQMSFEQGEMPKYREVEMFGNTQTTIDLSGRMSVDYLALFKKYEREGRPSYKLENIAAAVLPDLPKLKYEGTLHSLYRKDFNFFIRYNIRDTEILKGFEETLGYVQLAIDMYHLSYGLMKHTTGTIKLAELAVINHCHHILKLIVPNNRVDENSEGGIAGAYVLEPKIGMHEYIGSIDISSLYPSVIRSLNISPETIIGQFTDNGRACEEISKQSVVTLNFVFENNETKSMRADEWNDELRKNKWAISGYGTVFDQNKQGIIPAVLDDWYATRKHYKKLMLEAKKEGDKNKAAYYDRLQYVYKIKLNSFYGALANRFFRFNDSRMGESTTGTGRMILQHQGSQVNKLLGGEYDYTGESVLAGDTDSIYFSTYANNNEEAVLIADTIAYEVNKTFAPFVQERFLCNEEFDKLITAEREIVADRGIFVEKKRYILHVTNNKGDKVDKLKVMGLDTKKTTLPKQIGEDINNFVGRLLKGEEWDSLAQDIVDYKENLITTEDVMQIGLPKGVQKVEDYTHQMKLYGVGVRLPGHVAASIHYNQCLEEYNDKESLAITSGMKIKVFYLKQKFGRFKSIALPTDTEVIPQWFVNNYVHLIDRDAHIERLVDNPLNNIIHAIDKVSPTKQIMLTDSLIEW